MAIRIFGKDPGNANTNEMYVDSTGMGWVRSVSESEIEEAVENGDGYNINTGVINLTSNTESGVIYFKNNEDKTFKLDALAVGIGSAGTVSDMTEITIIKNPTAGTLISGASAVAINENRKFGSSNALLNSLAYKGAEGNTVTDGDDYALFFQSAGSRGYYSITTELSKGQSIAVKINTLTTAGTTKVYAALVGHQKTIS